MRRLQTAWGVGLGLIVGMTSAAGGRAEEPSRIFQSAGKDLAWVKQRQAKGDPAVTAAIRNLTARADKALQAGPFSVVHPKPVPPPGGDPHDYVSMAPYWWPDPVKPGGLPYIRRDGRVNPERAKYDAPQLSGMSQAVGTLALAYYLTGDERYAAHAAKLLRAWFLDEATRMNPNLKYGQFIPGRNDGRGNGIIDTTRLLEVVDAVGLLHGSKHWTAADQAGVEAWFREYLRWLRTSKTGQEEAAAANNHGTWYDVQVVTYALFLNDQATARRVLEESKTKRIARQIEPDGSQPLELKRTRSFSYSVVNLRGLFALATLGEQAGADLWNYQTEDGRGIRRALDWLLPFATREKEWPHQQITGLSGSSLAPLLRRAANAYREHRYEQAIGRLPAAGREREALELRYPLHP